MEIINYVQQDSYKRGFSFPGFQKHYNSGFQKHGKLGEKINNHIRNSVFKSETSSYCARQVRRPVSVKTFFKVIGAAITDFQDYVTHNVKKVLITSASVAVLVAGLFSAYHIASHIINSTGPLAFETENSLDIENLNKLMASFALDGIVEYDEAGNLLDTADFIPQVFTQPVTYKNYTVKSGDTISGITKKFGLKNLSTLISVNDIGNVRQLAAGQKLKIPSIDGVVYTVKNGDSINSIVTANSITLEQLLDVNDLESETLTVGQQLFLPGVALDSKTLKNAMGDLFKLPIAAPFRWTSMYGKRIDPIAGVESFHTGVDMACPTGTPILASMSGRVTKTGVTRVYGNYLIIDHGNGYQTLYAHMSKIIATEGQWVNQGTRIGLVGSTGYSTGPHLHFTVYKNGQLINPMSVLNK